MSDDEIFTDFDLLAEINEAEKLREPMRSGSLNALITSSLLFRSDAAASFLSPCFSSNIPLMRLVQSVHHSKRRPAGALREGWLLHHTNTDALVRVQNCCFLLLTLSKASM